MRKWSSELGMSLVEATIILMVLATLTSVIAPSAADYIEESRNVRAKEDVEVIGIGIARLLRDTGLPCVSLTPTVFSAACTVANKVELLVSGSSETANLPTTDAADYAVPASTASNTALNWAATGATTPVAEANRAIMDPHLVSNSALVTSLTAPYTAAGFTGGGGPRANLGWRGAYLNGPIDVDPWGYTYQANVVFSAPAAGSGVTGNGQGAADGGWGADMLVVSAGGNGNIQTAFGSGAAAGTVAVGDDVVYVIQGSTR
jgi:hypothetical protein